MTVGIEALGIEIPRRRLTGELLAGAWGSGPKGSRAVAGLHLATTTVPLEDGGKASQVAAALDLRDDDVFIAESGGSIGAGAQALRAVSAAVRAGAERVAGAPRGNG